MVSVDDTDTSGLKAIKLSAYDLILNTESHRGILVFGNFYELVAGAKGIICM